MSEKYEQCPTCYGRGFIRNRGVPNMTCYRCKGKGKIPISEICSECKGEGYFIFDGQKMECGICHGTGQSKT